jgi:hypothetical protein
MPFIGSPFAFLPGTMLAAIERVGVTSDLKLCLDAGDLNSYSGAGQSWLDTSGNGHDFFRGTTSASQSTDPTFNGTAGRQSSSEYWSYDGGDFFTYDTTNETWMQNIHKNNALFTIAAWIFVADSSQFQGILGTSGNSNSNVGFFFQAGSTSAPSTNLSFGVQSGSALSLGISKSGVPTGSWCFVAFSLNEATGAYTMQINDSQDAGTEIYSSPSSSSASFTFMIGGNGGPSAPNVRLMASGSRIANLSAWEGVSLTASHLDSIFQVTRGKFGI